MTALDSFLVRTTSPIGRLEVTASDTHVTTLTIERDGTLPHDHRDENPNQILERALHQLEQYFADERHEFDLPLQPAGTEFQRAIWQSLQEIPWGAATTYGELGQMTGRATAGRAVGGAIGANPIPVFIGCHRVLGSNGAITGYSGGDGIPTKLWLLAHEGITLAA